MSDSSNNDSGCLIVVVIFLAIALASFEERLERLEEIHPQTNQEASE